MGPPHPCPSLEQPPLLLSVFLPEPSQLSCSAGRCRCRQCRQRRAPRQRRRDWGCLKPGLFWLRPQQQQLPRCSRSTRGSRQPQPSQRCRPAGRERGRGRAARGHRRRVGGGGVLVTGRHRGGHHVSCSRPPKLTAVGRSSHAVHGPKHPKRLPLCQSLRLLLLQWKLQPEQSMIRCPPRHLLQKPRGPQSHRPHLLSPLLLPLLHRRLLLHHPYLKQKHLQRLCRRRPVFPSQRRHLPQPLLQALLSFPRLSPAVLCLHQLLPLSQPAA